MIRNVSPGRNRPKTILHNFEDALEHDPPTAECCRIAPPVIEFDFEGNVVQAWGGPGEGYTWPQNSVEDMHNPPLGRITQSWNGEHTVYVDHNENVWIANSGTTNDAHVLKFSRTGEFLLMVGRLGRGEGSNDTTALGKPTGIVVPRPTKCSSPTGTGTDGSSSSTPTPGSTNGTGAPTATGRTIPSESGTSRVASAEPVQDAARYRHEQ